MLRRIYKLFTVETLLSLFAIFLWVMQWCQTYTGMVSVSMVFRKWGGDMAIVIAKGIYWVSFVIVAILFSLLVIKFVSWIRDRGRGGEGE